MHPRHSFRPTVVELLEDRTLPSHGGLPVMSVGVLGDSYSNEYQFAPPHRTQARSWVEILAATRGVRFGAFTTQDWGDARLAGFQFDWARDGATSAYMVQDELPGLRAQVAHGQVNAAWIFIGSNDFNSVFTAAATGNVPVSQALAQLNQEEANLEANLTTTVNTLLAANPNAKVVVSTLFDLSLMPGITNMRWRPEAQVLLDALSQAIQRYNTLVRVTAAGNPRVAVVDIAGMMTQLFQEAGPNGTVPFANARLNLGGPGDEWHHLFLADRMHFGTVFQGMIADAFIAAVDTAFGAHLAHLTPQQILRFARRVQAGAV
jgi:hypothetical protein